MNAHTSDSVDELDIVSLVQHAARVMMDRLERRKYVKLERFARGDQKALKHDLNIKVDLSKPIDVDGLSVRVLLGVAASLSLAHDVVVGVAAIRARQLYNAAKAGNIVGVKFKGAHRLLGRNR
ncbi:MAG: hypothetical protein QXH56_07855 [Thermoprotei archaeon]